MMPHDRRVNLRKTPRHLGYLSLPPDNGGVVLDVSEGGLGFQAIAPVRAKGPIQFRFAIDSPTRIKAVGELAWSDDTGKGGGLRFTQLPEGVREKIREWVSQPKDALLDLQVAVPVVQVVQPVPVGEPPPSTPPPTPREILERIEAKPALALPPAPAAVVAEAPAAFESAPPASEVKAEPAPVTEERSSLLHNVKPPIYSGSSNKFSMFPVTPDSKVETTAFAVPQPNAIAHPIAAIALTIVLALLVSVPICVFVTSGRAGDALFDWSRRIRGVTDPPVLPRDLAPPPSAATDLAKPPQP